MKLTYKKIISLLLTVSMLCSAIPALALEDCGINITLSDDASVKYDIVLPNELPQIEINEDDVIPIMSDVSHYNTINTDEDEAYTGTPKISATMTNTLVIPDNRMELTDISVSLNIATFNDDVLAWFLHHVTVFQIASHHRPASL